MVFTSPYRGGTKTWSTTHHLTGGDWQDQTHFNTFSDALTSEWLGNVFTHTTLVETVGYNPGSDLPVFSKAYATAGSLSLTSREICPLEACVLLRFTTDQRTTKNHPVYLFNYIHDQANVGASAANTPAADILAAWASRSHDLVAGFSDGTLTRKRAGPRGAVAQAGTAEAFLTHRDFRN